MKGFLILSEGRSGTEWLRSMTNATGVLGTADEWLMVDVLDGPSSPAKASEHLDAVVARASTPNGRFGIKVFPHQLRISYHRYGNDFIRDLRAKHDVAVFVVERRDRMRQAVSFARAEMTAAWADNLKKKAAEVYDYQRICKAFFRIEEAYAFWRAYLGIHAIEHQRFYYEDLVGDPTPFIAAVAQTLDVEMPAKVESSRKVQRDGLTEEWVERFRAEAGRENVLEAAAMANTPRRNIRNLIRFFRRQGF